MTQTSVSIRQIDGTSNTLSNTVIEQLLAKNMSIVPLPHYSEAELEYAAALKDTVGQAVVPGCTPAAYAYIAKASDNGNKPLNDFVIPYYPSNAYNPGSTDVGDVSWLTPTAQFTAVTWVSGSPGHSWQNVTIGKTSIAHKGMLYAAKILAGTASDMMSDSDVLQQIRQEFCISAANGYDCPIDNSITIPSN